MGPSLPGWALVIFDILVIVTTHSPVQLLQLVTREKGIYRAVKATQRNRVSRYQGNKKAW